VPDETADRGAGQDADAVDRLHEELGMGLDVAPIGSPSFSPAPERAPRARAAAASGARDAAALSPGEIPPSPPPEVLEAMDAAGRVARELHEQGRELRFVPPSHDGTDGGRVRVEVVDLDGNVLRTIPPSELLDIATGAPLD
jgi:hypothetical protein